LYLHPIPPSYPNPSSNPIPTTILPIVLFLIRSSAQPSIEPTIDKLIPIRL